MTFAISKLLWILVAPGNFILYILIIGLFLNWTTCYRTGRILASLAGLGFLAVAIFPIGAWLLVPLETRFSNITNGLHKVDGIVLLGGSTSPGLTEIWDQPAMNGNAERIFAFSELARKYPNAQLIFTGGHSSIAPGRLRQADVVHQILDSLGNNSSRVQYDRRARNTHENALNAYGLANPTPQENWLVVTSARHMPRAVGCFRNLGWSVIGYPVDYRTGGRAFFSIGLSFGQNLNSFNEATHEWIGLISYYFMGRTKTLFPGPEV